MEKNSFLGINWKVRATNPTYWVSIFISVATIIGVNFGVKGEDITSWGTLFEIIGSTFANPYLLFMIVVAIITNTISYTDKGVRDTGFVKTLERPRDDKDPKQAAGFINEKDKEEIENPMDGLKELVKYESNEDASDIEPYEMDEEEEFYKDEARPYGVDFEEKPVDVNVNNINKNDKESKKEEVEAEDEDKSRS